MFLKLVVITGALVFSDCLKDLQLHKVFGEDYKISSVIILSLGILAYMFVLAIPYFPGLEIGLALMILFGEAGIFTVYLSTIAGLAIAFITGKLAIKSGRVKSFYDLMVKSRITDSVSDRKPFITLMVLLNLPGNIVLGGGGGIAMNFGYSEKLSLTGFLVSVMVATAPLPVFFLACFS